MGEINIRKPISKKLFNAYGSRHGFIQHYRHRILYFLQFYQDYRSVDWESVERLVFVCKGNICRSAFAEAVARSKGVDAISCGLDTVEAAPADKNAIRTAGEMGFNLERHRTTPVTSVDFKEHDLLVVMEPWQAEYLKKERQTISQCTLLGLWARPVRPYIHDPYNSSSEYFENCFEYLEKSVNDITSKIKASKN